MIDALYVAEQIEKMLGHMVTICEAMTEIVAALNRLDQRLSAIETELRIIRQR